MIRTADVSPSGDLKVTAGATLVRDSVAAYEVAETHAKAAGILTAFGLVAEPATAAEGVDELDPRRGRADRARARATSG